jgi:DNA-directed RNA polymerase subunit N (RpoN/RPB10)
MKKPLKIVYAEYRALLAQGAFDQALRIMEASVAFPRLDVQKRCARRSSILHRAVRCFV